MDDLLDIKEKLADTNAAISRVKASLSKYPPYLTANLISGMIAELNLRSLLKCQAVLKKALARDK